jgi:hypothetical protein
LLGQVADQASVAGLTGEVDEGKVGQPELLAGVALARGALVLGVVEADGLATGAVEHLAGFLLFPERLSQVWEFFVLHLFKFEL